MPRLFVDVDGTLIDENDELDISLIGDINCFLDHHEDYILVVWSGGGERYAERWGEKAFGPAFDKRVGYFWHWAAKDMRTPTDQDICVDDMYGELTPRDKRVRVIHPRDFGRCPLCLS